MAVTATTVAEAAATVETAATVAVIAALTAKQTEAPPKKPEGLGTPGVMLPAVAPPQINTKV